MEVICVCVCLCPFLCVQVHGWCVLMHGGGGLWKSDNLVRLSTLIFPSRVSHLYLERTKQARRGGWAMFFLSGITGMLHLSWLSFLMWVTGIKFT